MSLKHPQNPPASTRDLAVDPMLVMNGQRDPASPDPVGRDAARGGLPDRPRRADARRQRAAEPRDVRDDVDGAAGPAAHGRVLRQEHDRQGRVPADRRARDAVRRHARRLWNAPDATRRPAARRPGRARRRCSAAWRSSGAGSSADAPPGKPADQPNLVMGINVQVCWEKFANYWDVELRLVPMEGDALPPHRPRRPSQLCDENTIGVVAILGSTFDGSLRAGRGDLRRARRPRRRDTGLDIPVHVDGASGAFVAPFIDPRPRLGLPPAARRSRSTPRATSTASSTRASAGSSGATPTRCPTTSSSGSTTSAATCRPSR